MSASIHEVPAPPASAPAEQPRTGAVPTRPRPDCPGCGGAGRVAYEDLTDLLFGAPGTWRMRECGHRGCGMLWLDPAPREDAIPLLYERYYTHEDLVVPSSAARSLYARVMDAYVTRRFGYRRTGGGILERALARLLPLSPGRRSLAETGVAELPFRPGGRLLEVGCGGGAVLLRLQRMGWEVQGIDFDSRAVENARRKGLAVRLGGLDEASFPEGTFDAVVASHVIEHLPEPAAFLRAARRVLRPGGTLVLDTPNAASHGRRRFGRHWRGLEPPRHLMLFTPASLEKLLAEAGFRPVRWKPVECSGVLTLHSRMLARAGGIDPRRNTWVRLAHELADLAEWARTRLSPVEAQVIRAFGTAP